MTTRALTSGSFVHDGRRYDVIAGEDFTNTDKAVIAAGVERGFLTSDAKADTADTPRTALEVPDPVYPSAEDVATERDKLRGMVIPNLAETDTPTAATVDTNAAPQDRDPDATAAALADAADPATVAPAARAKAAAPKVETSNDPGSRTAKTSKVTKASARKG